MSFRRVSAVFALDGLCMRDKMVLLALAHFENEKTGKCFPSVAAIARAAGCSESCVRRALLSCKAKGVIECKSFAGAVNEYKIITPKLDGNTPVNLTVVKGDTPVRMAGVQNDTPVKLIGETPVRLIPTPVRLTPEHRSNLECNKQEYINKPEPPPPSEASPHCAHAHTRTYARGTPADAGLAAADRVKMVPVCDSAIPGESTSCDWKPWPLVRDVARFSEVNLHVDGYDLLLNLAADAGKSEGWLLDRLAVLAARGWRDSTLSPRRALSLSDRFEYLKAAIAAESGASASA